MPKIAPKAPTTTVTTSTFCIAQTAPNGGYYNLNLKVKLRPVWFVIGPYDDIKV